MKTIVFVRPRPAIRIYKIAKALRKSNHKYRLILICRSLSFDEKLYRNLFDKILFYSPEFKFNKQFDLSFNKRWNKQLKLGYRKIMRMINEINPDLIHTMAEPFDFISYIIKHSKWPVVLDAYDYTGITAGLNILDDKTRIEEKYCLENADGISHKGPDYEIDYYRQHGYKITCPELNWMDYCDEDIWVSSEQKKLSDADGEHHLVYTGGVSNNPGLQYIYYIPLAKQLAKQKIHFHIYPKFAEHRLSYERYKEYIDLAKSEPYFHFHKTLPLNDLIKEIATYDWGLWVHSADVSKRTHTEKVKTGSGNKIFTYLEAGLPMIVSSSRIYGKKIIEGNEIGISIDDFDWDKFDKLIESQDYDRLRKNVLDVREDLSLHRQVSRLSSFYELILDNNKNRSNN
jgi:hypothetical protein